MRSRSLLTFASTLVKNCHPALPTSSKKGQIIHNIKSIPGQPENVSPSNCGLILMLYKIAIPWQHDVLHGIFSVCDIISTEGALYHIALFVFDVLFDPLSPSNVHSPTHWKTDSGRLLLSNVKLGNAKFQK